jgi:hypothetical protein
MRNNAILGNREPEDGGGRSANYSGMTAMSSSGFLLEW